MGRVLRMVICSGSTRPPPRRDPRPITDEPGSPLAPACACPEENNVFSDV